MKCLAVMVGLENRECQGVVGIKSLCDQLHELYNSSDLIKSQDNTHILIMYMSIQSVVSNEQGTSL